MNTSVKANIIKIDDNNSILNKYGAKNSEIKANLAMYILTFKINGKEFCNFLLLCIKLTHKNYLMMEYLHKT